MVTPVLVGTPPEPLRYEDYAGKTMDYEAFRKIAYQIESEFQKLQKRLERELAEGRYVHKKGKKRGGAARRVTF